MNKQIGKVTRKIIKVLGLNYKEEVPIFIGEANINHMKEEHPEDFKKYRCKYRRYYKKSYLFSTKRKEKIYRIYKRIQNR